MMLFDLPQARHFCAPAPAIVGGIGNQSLAAFHGARAKSGTLKEGTLGFQVHQVNLLYCVERWLAYSLGHYRRSIDMLVPVSAPWAHVTLYYASFFAANAILGMFGGWIGETRVGNCVVDVALGTVGSQELRVRKKAKSPNGARGSHKSFWDFFYAGTAMLGPWAPAELVGALDPVNGDYAWQISERNNVNYDMFHAWAASTLFHTTFMPARLDTITGPLELQLDVAEGLLKLGLHFANATSVAMDALSGCGAAGTRAQIQRRLAMQAPPRLVAQSGFGRLLET